MLNGIRCDKLSAAVATERAHPHKYKKDFNTGVTFLSQYIDKKSPTPNVKIASARQRMRQVVEDQGYLWHFKGKDSLEEVFQRGI